MLKYRLRLRKGSGPPYNKVLVQEKRWYGYKTVAKFYTGLDGVAEAKALIKELEQL